MSMSPDDTLSGWLDPYHVDVEAGEQTARIEASTEPADEYSKPLAASRSVPVRTLRFDVHYGICVRVPPAASGPLNQDRKCPFPIGSC